MAMDRDPCRVYGIDDRGYHTLVHFGLRKHKQVVRWNDSGNVHIFRWRADTAGEIHFGKRIEETGEIHLREWFRQKTAGWL